MFLFLLHPEVATRDCADCQLHSYNEKTGKRDERNGVPCRRPPGTEPCRTATGCPKGTPEDSRALSPKNELAYQFYYECKAVGEFPDDAIVRRNAGIIKGAEDAVDQIHQGNQQLVPQLLLGLLGRGNG